MCCTPLELGANVNARDMVATPLHKACLAGSPLLVSLLIEKGADIAAGDIDGETPLAYAARVGKPDIVKVLYEYGANICSKDKDGNTPVHNAASRGHTEALKALLLSWTEANVLGTNKVSFEEMNNSGKNAIARSCLVWTRAEC